MVKKLLCRFHVFVNVIVIMKSVPHQLWTSLHVTKRNNDFHKRRTTSRSSATLANFIGISDDASVLDKSQVQ